MKQYNIMLFVMCFFATALEGHHNQINAEIFFAMITVILGITIVGKEIIEALKQK